MARDEDVEHVIRRVLTDMGVMPGTDVIARRIRRELMDRYPELATDAGTAIESLCAAPTPECESVLKGKEWSERYRVWWHKHASDRALDKLRQGS